MLAEKVTLKINDVSHHPGPLAWVHHGWPARDIRAALKAKCPDLALARAAYIDLVEEEEAELEDELEDE